MTHPRRTSPILVLLTAVSLIGLVGCSSSKKTTTPSTTPTTAAATSAAAAPSMTVTPAKGLKEGQKVTVTGTGFPANDSLGINECGDKGAATGAGDCNLAKIVLVTSDASGALTGTFAVAKGPFGANKIVCSATQKCLLSISELTATSTVNASQDIAFG